MFIAVLYSSMRSSLIKYAQDRSETNKQKIFIDIRYVILKRNRWRKLSHVTYITCEIQAVETDLIPELDLFGDPAVSPGDEISFAEPAGGRDGIDRHDGKQEKDNAERIGEPHGMVQRRQLYNQAQILLKYTREVGGSDTANANRLSLTANNF